MKADLHCHSTFSDGTETPTQIVALAKEKNCNLVTITDHDTFRGFEELKTAAQKEGLAYISGIEISTLHENLSVHLLGYCFDPTSLSLKAYEDRLHVLRKDRALQIIQKLQQCGVNVTEEDLLRYETVDGSVGRPHIARLLVEKNYGATLSEVFRTYLAEGKMAYVPHERLSIQQAISLIHGAKGFAVLAHPHLFRNRKVVRKLLDLYEFDGIEAFYCRFGKKDNSHWIQCAKERQLLITGGSDFHGEAKEGVFYGNSLAPEDSVDQLWDAMQKL